MCAAEPRGSVSAVEALVSAARDQDVHAIVVVGDLGAGPDRPAGYRGVFRALARAERPVFWVPGPGDAPVDDYLRESHNIEVVFPDLHGIHGTTAFSPGEAVVFAGLGGEIDDDPSAPREEIERLRYPRWEAEYRLKPLREMSEHQVAMAFWTRPAHKGLGTQGSEAVAELIGTYRPRLAVCAGEPGREMLGRTMVVAPGSLGNGQYAVADLHAREVRPGELAAAAR